MNIELSNEETEILEKLLGSFISDTRVEIRRTETGLFQSDLRAQQNAARRLLEKLTASRQAS